MNDLNTLKDGYRLLFHAYMTGDDYGNDSEEAFRLDASLGAFERLFPNGRVALEKS